MARQLITQAWDLLQRDGEIPRDSLCPMIKGVSARKSKVLRAEPIAQAVATGRAKFARGADLATLQSEFTLWQPGSTWSPGALDAGVYAATEVLPEAPTGASVMRPTVRRGEARGSSQFGGRKRTA